MKTTNINFRIETETKEEFKKVCDNKLQNMSKVLIQFMKDYVEKNKNMEGDTDCG